MSISQLCISVPLSNSCTDFTVNSKFSANRGSYLQCFSWLKHWTKRFCADCSRSVAKRHRKLSCGIVRCNSKDEFWTAHELAYMIFTGLRIIGRIVRWFCQANQIVPESYVMMTEVLLNHNWWFFQQSQNHSWNHNVWNRECLESSPGNSLLLWNRLWNHNLVPNKRERWIHEWKIVHLTQRGLHTHKKKNTTDVIICMIAGRPVLHQTK